MPDRIPPQAELESLLSYDGEAGLFLWKERPLSAFPKPEKGKTWNKQFAGKAAFAVDNGNGYLCGYIHYKKLYAHRVAWKLIFGDEPNQIDHINGVRSDNRILNLRAATNEINSKNHRARTDNTSGVTGVSWSKQVQKWLVHISHEKQVKSIGYFESFEEAVAARKGAERALGYHPNHGRK